MAADGSQLRQFDALLSKYEKELIDAFAEAIEDLRSQAEVRRVIEMLERGDVEAAMQALHIDRAAFQPVSSAVGRAYQAGGSFGASIMPKRDADGLRLVIRFDGSNPRAEAWLRDHSATLVTRIVEDQRVAVRAALVGGMERGENPRRTALDVIGRTNKATGKREGSILGLTSPQERAVTAARAELASADPAVLRAFLDRKRRDKRFDRSIEKAIREGKPLPAKDAQRIGDRYADRLLALRGEMLARTEALTSLHAGQYQALLQAVDAGKVQANQIRRTWRSAADARVRHTHRGLNGDTVGLDEAFVSPSGARLRFPGDTALGAPASETIGCRCWCSSRIDFLANL